MVNRLQTKVQVKRDTSGTVQLSITASPLAPPGDRGYKKGAGGERYLRDCEALNDGIPLTPPGGRGCPAAATIACSGDAARRHVIGHC